MFTDINSPLYKKCTSFTTLVFRINRDDVTICRLISINLLATSYLRSQENFSDADRIKEKRSRPNVIFEFGYFVGKLGRGRVCCLHTGGVILPSDLSGLVYKAYSKHVEELGLSIVRELTAAGYDLTFKRDAG